MGTSYPPVDLPRPRIAAGGFFAAAGFAPPVRMEMGANEAIKQAVIAGLGLSVLSRGTCRLELAHGHLVELDAAGFPLQRHGHVAWPGGRRLSAGAAAFRAILPANPPADQASGRVNT